MKLEAHFKELYFQHFESLVRFAHFYCNDHDEASSAVQQVFLTIWERREDLLNKQDMKSYLFTAVRNRVFNDRRKKQISQELVDDAITNEVDAIQKLEAAELQQQITLAIESLPERCKYIFNCSREQNMSYAEIAKHLDLSVKTVENQIGKALKILRNVIYGVENQ